MTRYAGALACLKANTVTTDVSFAAVAQVKNMDATIEQDAIDSSVLKCGTAATWTTTTDGLQKASYSFNGFWDDYGDATGQKIIMDNAVSGATLWLKYLFGDSDGVGGYFKSEVMVDSLEITTTPDATVDISVSAQSTGIITFATNP